MAEATGTEITNTNTGVLSRISGIFSNVKKLRSDPAVQKSVPLAFGIIVTFVGIVSFYFCLLYTSPSPRDATLSRMPSSA